MTGFGDPGLLTLEQALALARKNSPELRAARTYAQAAEKNIASAGLMKNPKLEVEAEGVGWDNDLFNEGEYTIGIKQELQMGGKRKRDRDVALKSADIATHATQEEELELTIEVRRAFIEVMAQQEIGKVRVEQEQLGRAFVEVAKRHHEAGSGSELDVVQAELAMEEIVLAQTCCFGDLLATQEQLASLLGLTLVELPELTAPYYDLEAVTDIAIYDSHPSLRKLDAMAEKIRAEAARAKAQDSSNISLGAGYKYEAADENNSLVFAVTVPLSFNRRGRAEYMAGLLRADAVQAESVAVRRKLRVELAMLLALYNGAKIEAELTKENLIPKATQAHNLSRAGYDVGRFSWLELIAAQQKLADIRVRYIESLRDAHRARAQIYKFMKEGV